MNDTLNWRYMDVCTYKYKTVKYISFKQLLLLGRISITSNIEMFCFCASERNMIKWCLQMINTTTNQSPLQNCTAINKRFIIIGGKITKYLSQGHHYNTIIK